jgi:uncharacterized protein YbbK (DUF523 family)
MERQGIKVGISACVMGEKVRFDGGHKASRFVENELSPHFEFVKVCPEVGIGMPVPRPTIRLVSNEERVLLVDTKDDTIDYTQKNGRLFEGKIGTLSQTRLVWLHSLCKVSNLRHGTRQSV